MDVTVIGGRGFVGSALTPLLREKHEVTTVDPSPGGNNHITADITEEESLDGVLDGVDAAVNLAGLTPLKDLGEDAYEAVHVHGAENVVRACSSAGVERLVHMSAVGADPDADTAYLRTKGAGRDIVLGSDVDTTVFEPSIIFDDRNQLVRIARKLAPTRLFPDLRTPVQPVYRQDVAELFRMAVEGAIADDVLQIGGPEGMTLFEFVEKIYASRGYSCVPVPARLLLAANLHLAVFLPLIPFGNDQFRFIEMDHTVDVNDAETYIDLASVDEWLENGR